MAWIWDLAAVAVIVLAGVIGYHRGFFKSVMQLVSGIVALLLAAWLAAPIAGQIFDLFLSDRITDALENRLTETAMTGEKTLGDSLDTYVEELPGPLQELLRKNGLNGSEIAQKFSLNGTETARTVAETVVREVLRPGAVKLIELLCFFLLFVVLLVALFFVTKVVNKVLHLPVLRQINGLLGAVVGVAEGLLLACVLCTLLGWRAGMAQEESFITEEQMEQTVLVQRLDQSSRLDLTELWK